MPNPAVPARTIDVPARQLNEIQDYARNAGITVESAVEEALQDYIDVVIAARGPYAKGGARA